MPRRTHRPFRAFTLVELMVSIFLLMLVMVGVNTVFSTTSATVGTNTAISTLNRDARAVQSVLNRDFSNIASDGPMMILRAEQLFAFQSLRDYNTDADKIASTIDLTGSGTEPAAAPMDYTKRSHRVDRFSFFTRQLLQRQTGNDGTFIANMTSSEQWVWLGQLELADGTAYNALTLTTFQGPGVGNTTTNPNNYFGEQWILGRVATGLVKPDASGKIYDNSKPTPLSQVYIGGAGALSPLSTNTQSTDGLSYIQQSRYDLAGTTIYDYTQILTAYIAANPTGASSSWWSFINGSGPTTRFQGMNYANRPLDAKAVSRMHPALVTGCAQFIVEYAGDFVKQDPTTGAVTDAYATDDRTSSPATRYTGTTDGVIDFIIPSTGPQAGQRQIRWYGFPRNTSGGTTVTMTNGDVCPLRDTIRSAGAPFNGANIYAPFERTGGSGGTDILASLPQANYATLSGTGGYRYVCAWGPTDTVRPKMIRIVMRLEDPTGRLPDGQSYEYVYTLP
jgi:hypothetical protein